MGLIDERGRVLGRVNVIDGIAVALLVLIGGGVYVGYRLLRVPPHPVVLRIEPTVQQVGSNLKLSVRGEHFLPFMRVFVQRSGTSPQPVHDGFNAERSGIDQYTLVNSTQARFLVETPDVAEIWLPNEMGPGSYDLVFYNQTEQVAVKIHAFDLTAPPAPKRLSGPSAAMRVYGAFTGFEDDGRVRIAKGDRLPSRGEPWAEVLEVAAPQPATTAIRSRDGELLMPLQNRRQIPAVLLVHCIVTDEGCSVSGGRVAVGGSLAVQVGDDLLKFAIDDIGSDPPEVVRQAHLDVRFITKPEVARLIRAGDRDEPKPTGPGRARAAAHLVWRGETRDVTSSVGLALNDLSLESYTMQDKVVEVAAKVTVPVVRQPTGWSYNGQLIRAGGAMVFQTDSYAVRGWILGLTFDGPATDSTTHP